ncbi:hypothetical protein SISNIDRAFT_547974 [Sistotremastrum niveocremeum HHB9708]|uniref:Small ribosomal subunit protein mS23 n=1 Tax=Sistotremastrum niveocremeum HHB9708 TaxID=1314777 RepID=A0A164XBE0_9AGAM|nr:hypothetical protein SISNIDRAFT_547974 [Sistotremastrum niveocremeum HHB9708]
MVRRIACQVHRAASRLLAAKLIPNEPSWLQAVVQHPPIPLPPRSTPSRTGYDTRPTPSRKLRQPPKPRPEEIVYLEDKVRRQFFRDHPFEAFRPRDLVEKGKIRDEHPVRGKEWVRLRQRGIRPSSEEAVRFVVNLHENHNMPLPLAYETGVAQFQALRSEFELTRAFAAYEARTYGAQFGLSESELHFKKEIAALKTWQYNVETDEGAAAARKRWKAIADSPVDPGTWSQGQDYVRLWKNGIRPEYTALVAAEPPATDATADFLGVTKKSTPQPEAQS